MTINNKTIMPPWLATVILAVISAAFVAWGIISVNNVRITRAEQDIQKQELKIDKIYDLLNEMKLDIKDIKNGTSNK